MVFNMLILSNDDVDALITVKDCIDAFAGTYQDAAAGTVINGRRSDMITETRTPDAVYSLKMVGGVVPRFSIGAIRINSDILSFPLINGKPRKVKVPAATGERWVGLVLLFDTHNGEPLALLPDGMIQRLRVGATSGLAVDYLARRDARIATVLGSGWQAGAQAMAVAAVRDLDELRVYSPNEQNCRQFAAAMQQKLSISVLPMASAAEAARQTDILLCATNSLQPVVSADMLHPGLHLGSIREHEIDPAALAAISSIVVHDRENMTEDHLQVAAGISHKEKSGKTPSDPLSQRIRSASSLAELAAGNVPGRQSAEQITCFLNYHGVGYQFAAAGAVLLEKARQAGRGTELPTEWFTQDVHS